MFVGKQQSHQREIALKSVVIFAILLMVSVSIAAGLYWNERRVELALLENSQRQRVDALADGMTLNLQAVGSDLMILAEGKALAALLNDGTPAARSDLAADFKLFAERKGIYGQIRYINNLGHEVVRVNRVDGLAEIVPEENLQEKKDRYYFQRAMQLQRGQIYTSPFDLNIENGRIEQPPKPTIRFATPVFDAQSRQRGVLVLNYLGQHLLDDLNRAAAGRPGEIMLLNAQGYWLLGPTPKNHWAFMYPERRGQSFAAEYPSLWREISTQQQGQSRDDTGLYSYATVRPIGQLSQADRSHMADDKYHWKLVSHVSPAALAAQTKRVLWNILFMLAGVSVLLAILSWLLGRSLVHQREARRRLAEGERLAAIGGAMTALAHESRNALQRSQAGLEMLALRLPTGNDAQELLAHVQEAQHDLRDLYEQARDWAAPLQPQPEDVDIVQLAGAVWEQLAHQRDGRHDELKFEPSNKQIMCRVDPRMITQVLRNIFENSMEAANPVEITVECANGSSQDRVQVYISDNGPGLDEEQTERIFEPFFTTRMRGTGLGMAISQRIVKAHGGKMSVHASNGTKQLAGMRIAFDLPRGDHDRVA